jgi:hypothetical protein
MLHDPIIILVHSRMQDRCREAARRALLAEACDTARSRGVLAVMIAHLFVWMGERIEGVRYAPIATHPPGRPSRGTA